MTLSDDTQFIPAYDGSAVDPQRVPAALHRQPIPNEAQDPSEQFPAPVPAFQDNPNAIVVDVAPRVPHNVVLGGQPYRALPMKMLTAVNLGKKLEAAGENTDKLLYELESFVGTIFGRGSEQTRAIMARMEDPEDGLDLPHVMDLVQKLIERTTKNPTM